MLPAFIIPGEAKSGTTSFYRGLVENPRILACDKKEPNNFIEYGGTSFFCRMHYPLIFHGLHKSGQQCITGEASAEYLSRPNVPKAIKTLLPDVKLIFLLRHPIARAVSDYTMMKTHGIETETLQTAMRQSMHWLQDPSLERLVKIATPVNAPPLRYLTKGMYAQNLRPWMEVFSRQNMMFIKSEEFFANPSDILNRAFSFLGLPPYRISQMPHFRKASSYPAFDVHLVKEMQHFFHPRNQVLYAMLGRSMRWEEETESILAKGAWK